MNCCNSRLVLSDARLHPLDSPGDSRFRPRNPPPDSREFDPIRTQMQSPICLFPCEMGSENRGRSGKAKQSHLRLKSPGIGSRNSMSLEFPLEMKRQYFAWSTDFEIAGTRLPLRQFAHPSTTGRLCALFALYNLSPEDFEHTISGRYTRARDRLDRPGSGVLQLALARRGAPERRRVPSPPLPDDERHVAERSLARTRNAGDAAIRRPGRVRPGGRRVGILRARSIRPGGVLSTTAPQRRKADPLAPPGPQCSLAGWQC